MDDVKYPVIEHGGNSKKIFGRLFDGDKNGNALLAVHRWGPVLPRHYADHGGHDRAYCEKKLLSSLTEKRQPLIRAVGLSDSGQPGRPPFMYLLTKHGHERLLELSEAYWPDQWPEVAIGPRTGARVSSVRWYPRWHHDNIARDVLLAAERDAQHLSRARIVDQVAEFKIWADKKVPTAIQVPSIDRRMKSDAANIIRQGEKSFADEIEIDQGTETLSSNDPDRIFQTIEGKIRSYWEVLSTGLVQEKYNVTSSLFRVLFVTVNETRARNIVALAGDCGLPSIETGKRPITPNEIFYATTKENAMRQFFGPHWIKVDGTTTQLAGRHGDE